MRMWAGLLACMVSSVAYGAPTQLRPYTHEVGGKVDGMVAMRDGVKLFTRAWLPEGEGPWPTVLMREPYPMLHGILNSRCKLFVQFGYACVWQDVRGQGKSEGAWEPFVHEADDGEDTLAWLVSRRWQDGQIAWMGESYLAATAFAAADRMPPEVKALVLTNFGTDVYGAMFEGGLIRHEVITAWMTLMPKRGQRMFAAGAYHKALKHRPRRTLDTVAAKRVVGWYRDWLDAYDPDSPLWQQPFVQQLESAPSHLDMPVLLLGGWSDAFVGPLMQTWSQLAGQARSTLVVGPWNHLGKVVGDLTFDHVDDEIGRDETVAQMERVLDWLDVHLQGRPPHLPVGKALTYVMGEDRWAVREAWPPPTEERTLWAGPGDAAGCLATLWDEAPNGSTLSYLYDPEDPTPSRGGAGGLAGALPFWFGVKMGPIDQKGLCAERSDLLGFQSAPLTEPLHLAGPIRAELTVATDAPDTAFAIRLVERTADGRDLHIREGIKSVSQRGVREAYVAGSQVVVSIETWPVEYSLQAGSRVVLQVGSASFPKYEAHPNTFESWVDAPVARVAQQQLVLGPSKVVLPVVVEAVAGTAAVQDGAKSGFLREDDGG